MYITQLKKNSAHINIISALSKEIDFLCLYSEKRVSPPLPFLKGIETFVPWKGDGKDLRICLGTFGMYIHISKVQISSAVSISDFYILEMFEDCRPHFALQ